MNNSSYRIIEEHIPILKDIKEKLEEDLNNYFDMKDYDTIALINAIDKVIS